MIIINDEIKGNLESLTATANRYQIVKNGIGEYMIRRFDAVFWSYPDGDQKHRSLEAAKRGVGELKEIDEHKKRSSTWEVVHEE